MKTLFGQDFWIHATLAYLQVKNRTANLLDLLQNRSPIILLDVHCLSCDIYLVFRVLNTFFSILCFFLPYPPLHVGWLRIWLGCSDFPHLWLITAALHLEIHSPVSRCMNVTAAQVVQWFCFGIWACSVTFFLKHFLPFLLNHNLTWFLLFIWLILGFVCTHFLSNDLLLYIHRFYSINKTWNNWTSCL